MYLDFSADDAAYGGYVWRTDAMFAAGVVGLGQHPLIALRAEVAGGRGDIRTDGLWASITCETPGEHWSVGLEAFAVGYDDPADALGDGWGDRVPLGFDLEWERGEDGVWRVRGDVLIERDRIDLDCPGVVLPAPPLDWRWRGLVAE